MAQQFPSHTRGIGSFVGPGWETDEMQQLFRQVTEQDRATQAAHYAKLDQEQEARSNREERERVAQAGNGADP